MADETSSVTALLTRVRGGDEKALDDLLPLVYRELHRLAQAALSRERSGHTLQPTALLNEAYLRLFASQTDMKLQVDGRSPQASITYPLHTSS